MKRIGRFEVLDLLGRGGMGSVYRVRDSQAVHALKLLEVANPDTTELRRFQREFAVIARLRHPSVVRVFEMGEHEGFYFYTMECIEGRPLDQHLQELRRQKEDWQAELGRLGGQLLTGLVYLHSQGIVHRDLKPDNLLVDERGRLRMLDFGLALSDAASRLTQADKVAGTPAYMAPEQIRGHQPGPAADLYAWGVVVYELLAGHMPFTSPTVATLMFQILNDPVPPLQGQPPELAALVTELLAKDPAARGTTGAVLQRWTEYFGRSDSPSGAVRPRVLEPRFVGRDSEVDRVLAALERGHGLLLLEGPGGVGKTRLLEELEAVGRTQGWRTCRSQCPEEGAPYQPWLTALRAAAENGFPPELERYAGVLGKLLPELAPHAPVSAEPLHKLHLFEGMRHLLGRQRLLILLDDLHLADVESLEFLSFLLRAHPEVVVAGTLRTESLVDSNELEKRIAHLVRLGGERVPLEPLTTPALHVMVAGMLGGATDSCFVERLQKRTHGNPRFVTELVRGLATSDQLQQREGTWRQVESDDALPPSVKHAVRLRLEGLDADEYRVAEAAAVCGLEFHVSWVERLLASGLVQDCLDRLARRRIVEEVEGRPGYYSFDCQLIQETLVEGVGDRKLFAAMASLLEASPERDLERLAWYHGQAGNDELASTYLLRAAEHCLASFAYHRAVELLRQAARLPTPPPGVEELLADALHGAARYSEAITRLGATLGEASEAQDRARLKRKLGASYYLAGDLEAACRYLKESLAELGVALPSQSKAAKASTVAGLLGRLLALRPSFSGTLDQARALAGTGEWLTRVLFFLRPPGWELDTIAMSLRQQSLALRLEGSEGREVEALAGLYAGLAYLLTPPRFKPGALKARQVLARATELAASLRPSSLNLTTLRDAGWLRYLAGDPGGLECIEEALARLRHQGWMQHLPLGCVQAIRIHDSHGRFDRSRLLLEEAEQVAHLSGNVTDRLLVQALRALHHAYQVDISEAWKQNQVMLDLLGEHPVAYVELLRESAEAWILLGEGEWQGAIQRAAQAQQRLSGGTTRMFFYELQVLSASARAGSGQDPAGLLREVRKLERECGDMWLPFGLACRRIEAQLVGGARARELLEGNVARAREGDCPLEERRALAALEAS